MLKTHNSTPDKITKGIAKALKRARLEAERRARVYGTERLLGFTKKSKSLSKA